MGSIAPPQPQSQYAFPLGVEEYAPSPTPSLLEWQRLWKVWDLATREMIPEGSLLTKPISLRNDLLFYLGHIPTFADIHLTRALQEDPTPPKYYQTIFERGIDPDVDNPDQCHEHSEVPDTWPPLLEMLEFQDRVRYRITSLYKNGKSIERSVQRALWIGFEHECLHLETFLYMIIQSDAVQPPKDIARPDFRTTAIDAQRQRVDNQWIKVEARDLVLGINPTDPEDESEGPERYYGWDNERPLRKAVVPEFEAKGRPITNEEYASYLFAQQSQSMPASWTRVETVPTDPGIRVASEKFAEFIRDKAVRTVFGPVPLQFALDWPIMASYDELRPCAGWLGGTIPTFEQARSIQQQVESENALSQWLEPNQTGKPDPTDVFVDLDGRNVGFSNFLPTPVTQNGSKLSSPLGGMGGAWEQTSSLLERFNGFSPMKIYKGYTADFFDGHHYIILGGSWATHPRIAGRKSFINWYQHNYVYPWATARLVRSI